MNNERKPLMPTSAMLTHLDVESVVAMDAAQHTFRAGFMFARDYYEDLITTGKLRVVEEEVGKAIREHLSEYKAPQ
jgi:hypothetical protein